MVTGQGFSITLSELPDFFDETETITSADGFNLAFAVVETADSEIVLDSSYFSFEVINFTWQ